MSKQTTVLGAALAASLMIFGAAAHAQYAPRQDLDRDGIQNRYDRDRDGDRVHNARDPDPDKPNGWHAAQGPPGASRRGLAGAAIHNRHVLSRRAVRPPNPPGPRPDA